MATNPESQGIPQPLEVSDFTGGKTDNYLDGEPNQQKEIDNLLLTDNGKPRQRPGSLVYDLANAQTPSGNNRIGEFITTEDILFQQVGRNLHYISGGTFNTLLGPTGNPVFTAGNVDSKISWAEWNKQYIVTNSDFSAPQKIYKDGSGAYRCVQAGLPEELLTNAISFANDIKSVLNAHTQNAVLHTSSHIAALVTAADAYDFESLVTLVKALITAYDLHDNDSELLVPVFHFATETANVSLSTTADPMTISEVVLRLNDIKLKYNLHRSQTPTHSAPGAAITTFSGVQFSGGGVGTNSYIYAVVPFYEYTVGTVTYQDYGPTSTFQRTLVGVINVTPITLSNLPVIVNGTTENYDTANIKWQIYRTQANGTTLTLVGEVTNGTTSFIDNFSDTSITSTTPLYTTGGVIDNSPPPKSKYVVVVNNCAWYGHCKIGDQIFKSRLYQSVQFDPDSVGGSSFIDIEDEIVGLGGINIYPIVFCKNHIYREEGVLDELGDGELIKREIARAVGGINHLSIVDAREGMFFAGTDGFYFTDGFNIKKLTQQLNDSYKVLTQTQDQRDRVLGQYDRENNRIYWAVSSTSAVPDNDIFWVLDLSWGIKDNSTFATISNIDSWDPSSIGIDTDNKTLVIGDRRGYLFKFDTNTATDPKIIIGDAASTWPTKAIIYNFEWIKYKFGTSYARKWVTGIVIDLANVTNVSMEISVENDNSRNFIPLSEIRSRTSITWGDDSIIWNSTIEPPISQYFWNSVPLITAKRRFPAKTLRCTYKSVRFTNSVTILRNSDNFGLADIDGTAKTVTLLAPGFTWPTDVVDQFITFAFDDYTQRFLITERNSNTVITFQDSDNFVFTESSAEWELKGIAKGEVIEFANFAIQWQMVTATQDPFRTSQTGANV
jgi:hypothetical protein